MAVALLLALAGAVRAAENDKAEKPGPFAPAIAAAQKRCVKLYGAGIGREHGYATGLIVSPDGLVLTADGIYLAGSRITLVTPDGKRHPAKLVRRSRGMHVALLKIEADTPDYFELPEKPNVKQGDWVLAVSNAFKVADGVEPLSVNLGVVSLRAKLDTKRRSQDIDYEGDMLLYDAITSNPGAPGGALVTADGQLAGMVGKLMESQSTNTRVNYAVPGDLLHAFVAGKDMTAPATPAAPPTATASAGGGPPDLGIRLFKLSGSRAPAYIDRVIKGSPADAAGLKKDDLVLNLNGASVRSVKAFSDLTRQLPPDAPVQLIIKRGDVIRQVTLTLVKE